MATTLHLRDTGEGPPLVILHGLFGSGNNWGAFAKALGDTHRILLPDLPDHGRSPHSPAVSVPAMADAIATLLDELALPAVALAGHSLGGKIAMQLALTAPQRVERLAVLDIAPIPYAPHHADLIDAMAALDLPADAPREEVDRALARTIPAAPIRQFLLTNLVRQGNRWGWRVNLHGIRDALPQLSAWTPAAGLPPYAGPTLFLAGADSHYVPRDATAAIGRWFPNARLTRLANAGHWLHADQPEATLAALRLWLSQ